MARGRAYMGSVSVDVDISDIIDEIDTEDLLKELNRRNGSAPKSVEQIRTDAEKAAKAEREYVADLLCDAIASIRRNDMRHGMHQLERLEAYLTIPSESLPSTYASLMHSMKAAKPA